MGDMYILEGEKAIPCPDIIEWSKWMVTADIKVASETICDANISTVFLGLDHSHNSGTPLLFETMVFGGRLAGEIDRYSTRNAAVSGHNSMVERVKAHYK